MRRVFENLSVPSVSSVVKWKSMASTDPFVSPRPRSPGAFFALALGLINLFAGATVLLLAAGGGR